MNVTPAGRALFVDTLLDEHPLPSTQGPALTLLRVGTPDDHEFVLEESGTRYARYHRLSRAGHPHLIDLLEQVVAGGPRTSPAPFERHAHTFANLLAASRLPLRLGFVAAVVGGLVFGSIWPVGLWVIALLALQLAAFVAWWALASATGRPMDEAFAGMKYGPPWAITPLPPPDPRGPARMLPHTHRSFAMGIGDGLVLADRLSTFASWRVRAVALAPHQARALLDLLRS